MKKEFAGLLALLRVKHWIKNGLVFLPLIFSSGLFQFDLFYVTLLSALVFSLSASAIYVVNDIRDIEKDRKSKLKKHRPLASGRVSIGRAVVLGMLVLIVAVVLGLYINLTSTAWVYLAIYIAVNVLYSFGLKNVPVIDVAILALGFVLRVLFGAEVIGVEVSSWLYLSVLSGALYLGLGKRRGEIRTAGGVETRKVNKYYTIDFLDKNMYVMMALLLVFYSLWAVGDSSPGEARLTIPLLMVLFMSYSLTIEKGESSGDPIEVLQSNKILALLAAAYIAVTVYVVYLL